MGRDDGDRVPLEEINLAASAVQAEGFRQDPGIAVDDFAIGGSMEVVDIQDASAAALAELNRDFRGGIKPNEPQDNRNLRHAPRPLTNIATLSPKTLVASLNIFLAEKTAAFRGGRIAKIPAEDLQLIENSLYLVQCELEDIDNIEREISMHPCRPAGIEERIRAGLHALIAQRGIEYIGKLLQEIHELQRELAAMIFVRRFFAKDKKDKLALRRHQLAMNGVFVEEAIGIRGLRIEDNSFRWDSIDPDGPFAGLERSYEILLAQAGVKKSWQMQWLVKKKIFERVKEELAAIELGGTPELLDLEAIIRECQEEELREAPQGHS